MSAEAITPIGTTDPLAPGGGPNQAFAEAFEEYSQRGLRYANSMLRSSADAEEVVQEAFCRLLSSRHRADDPERFGAILFATIHNLSIDVIRRRKRRPTTSITNAATAQMSLAEIVNDHTDASELFELEQLQTLVREAIESLPTNWADALRLRVDGGLSYEDIASVLRCTKPQVRTWIYRARRQLERELESRISLREIT